MKRILLSVLFIVFCLTAFVGCMKWDYGKMEPFRATGDGLFIMNEGNFQYGNATLSYYDPETKKVENEIFYRANAMKLGDVAQSMIVRDTIGWVVVNNSHVIFAISINTFKRGGTALRDLLLHAIFILFRMRKLILHKYGIIVFLLSIPKLIR